MVRSVQSIVTGMAMSKAALVKLYKRATRHAVKIGRMVELGDMSTLAAEIDDCEFYGRDRGDSPRDVDAQDYDDFDDFTTSFEGCEYFYVWNGNEWIVSQGNLVFDLLETLLPEMA